MSTSGRIHSIETLGALDGPGLRTVVFLQGCPLRCAYCHNPDTWQAGRGREISAQEVVDKVKRYKPYFKSNGGVTLSGGEPLLQGDFCVEILGLCKKEGIKTAIDTSGCILNKKAVDLADLIILDIKHTDPDKYKHLTGVDIKNSLEFLEYCKAVNKPLWIRQVILTGWNDTKDDMTALSRLIKGANVKKTELLPYHKMGIDKWEKLCLEYSLYDIEPPTDETMKKLYSFLSLQI